MKTAVIYARVSSREQAEGFSIDAQVKACKKKAKEENYKVVKIFKDEGFTGTNKDRPALKKLIQHCKDREIDVVIIHKIDRFARSVVDHSAIRATLMKYSTNLVSVTEKLGTKPHEVFLENIMASMAQYYTDNLKTEVRKGLMERFESGYHLSSPPYGYEVKTGSKIMQIIPEEAKVIRRMFSLYSTGKYSLKRVSDVIYKKYGYKTKRGKKFSKERVRTILKEVAYMGAIKYKKIERKTKGLHDPIVTKATFQHVQEIMAKRGNVKKKAKNKYEFLYKDFVACPICGKNLYAAYSTGSSGKKYLYYCCRNKKQHKCLNIKPKKIQSAFDKKLAELRFSEDLMDVIQVFIAEKLESYKKDAGKKVKLYEKKLEDIKLKKVEVYKDWKKGEVDDETKQVLESEIEDEEVLAQLSLNEEKIDYNNLLTELRMLINFGSKIDRYWEIASYDQRRQILSSMFTNVPTFENNELTNCKISPLYKVLKDAEEKTVKYGRGCQT